MFNKNGWWEEKSSEPFSITKKIEERVRETNKYVEQELGHPSATQEVLFEVESNEPLEDRTDENGLPSYE